MNNRADENRVPPGPGFSAGQNRGGRPRKDGTRADPAKTLAEMGISKRLAAEARLYASVPEDEFEAALDRWRADFEKTGRRRAFRHYLPDRSANIRHERETRANVARILSSAWLIATAHEFDTSEQGERMRDMAAQTIAFWERAST